MRDDDRPEPSEDALGGAAPGRPDHDDHERALEAELAPLLEALASVDDPPDQVTARRHIAAAAASAREAARPAPRRLRRAVSIAVAAAILLLAAVVAAKVAHDRPADRPSTVEGSAANRGDRTSTDSAGRAGPRRAADEPATTTALTHDDDTGPATEGGAPPPMAEDGTGEGSPPSTQMAPPSTSRPSVAPRPPATASATAPTAPPTTVTPAVLPSIAVLALSCPGVQVTGNGSSLVTTGLVAANCTDPASIGVGSGAMVQASAVATTGPAADGTRTRASVRIGGTTTPDQLAGVLVITDCTPTSPGSGCATRSGGQVSGGEVLAPGRYTSPIDIKAGAVVTLQPGIYDTPGFSVEPGASVVGAGAMVHVRSGGLRIDGCARLELSPLAAGPLAGLTLTQSPSNTTDAQITSSPGCAWDVRGTVYLPGARIEVRGDVTITGGRVVAASLLWDGGAHLVVEP